MFNFLHFNEFLEEAEGVKLANSTVYNILIRNNIYSPKIRRSTKKKLKIKEKLVLKDSLISSDRKDNIVDSKDAHPRKERAKYEGELLQMDASDHLWFGDVKVQLHAAIDDATGKIVGAYFDRQETLNDYYHVMHQTIKNYGIPALIFTDRRTIFEYNSLKNFL